MATGRLGAEDLVAVTYTQLYQVPADTFAVISVNMLNRNATAITARLAITDSVPPAAPNNADFLEHDLTIAPNGVLERTGIVLEAGKVVSVYANTTGVTAIAYGIETATA